ncbi:hypothetical protein [Adlercreutzia caecimuris]|uniref:Uncharacterized protein n=1 Tax=Adlercreutzia caecimuris B7 TaxID=1235794 RepID=R9L271_9ACTN|nr:hypothetical protein [Adlercreutzia caecimuris]EOS52899.1 hypothetical protein C811_00182 [Adlercreutzia caecimuris B7]
MGSVGCAIDASIFPRNGFGKTEAARLMRVGDYFPSRESLHGDIGNDILYQLCESHPLPAACICNDGVSAEELREQEGILAGKMWVIGRSYAASPERYAYVKSGKSKKPPEGSAEGYESFFSDVAAILFEGEPCFRGCGAKEEGGEFWERAKAHASEAKGWFREALDVVHELTSKTYGLRGGSNDVDILKKVADAVTTFGSAIQEARAARDWAIIACNNESENKSDGEEESGEIRVEDQYFPLSFSSKFLHFHLPRLVFIYDSISGDILAPNHRYCYFDGSGQCVSGEVGQFKIDCNHAMGRKVGDDPSRKYFLHASKELALATAISGYFQDQKGNEDVRGAIEKGRIDVDSGIPCYINITRMIDALVTNSKKEKDKNKISHTPVDAFSGRVAWEAEADDILPIKEAESQ